MSLPMENIRKFLCCRILINFLKMKQNKRPGKKYRFSKTKSNSKSVPVLKTKCSAGTGTEKVIRYCNSVQSISVLPTSGFRFGKVENVGVGGTAYYNGQFKIEIPEGLTKHYCYLKPFSVTNHPVQHSTLQFIHILSQVSSIDQGSLQKACSQFY